MDELGFDNCAPDADQMPAISSGRCSMEQIERCAGNACARLLGVPTVTLDDDLVDMGVSSLGLLFIMMKLLGCVSVEVESDFIGEVMFSRPTVRSLAAWVHRHSHAGS